MLNISPYHEKTHTCLQDNLMCVAKYFNKNYIYMYTNGLNISLVTPTEKSEYIEDKLIYCSNDFNMYKLVNITIHDVTNMDKKTLLNFIEENLQNNHPVAIFSNAFYCPWIKDFYMQHRISHSFLVVDINYSNNIVCCIDSYTTNDLIKISIDEVTQYVEKIGVYCNNEKKDSYTLFDVYNTINYELDNNISQKEKILCFADYVNNDSITRKDRFSTKNYYNFIFGMKMVLNGRKNIVSLLNFLGETEKHNESINIMKNVNEAVSQWETAINIIIKGLYTSRQKDFEKAARIICELSSFEQGIVEQIQTELKLLEENKYEY